jgi:hypothetical protein
MTVGYLKNQAYSSLSAEWYTPSVYVEAARQVLGGLLELDPASCAVANGWIRAARYYSLRENGEDGLLQPWQAKTLWLNPPFDQSARWSQKLLTEYRAGHIEQAIALLKFVPSYRWFSPLKAYPMVITDHRVSFWTAEGSPGKSRLDTAVAFIYFGLETNRVTFEAVFSQFGSALTFRPCPDWLECSLCGRLFVPKSWGGLQRQYCQPACRQKAYRLRKLTGSTVTRL